jgi:hypothetical protein
MNSEPETSQQDQITAATQNPAVARCCEASAQARHAARQRRRSSFDVDRSGAEAYRKAMPALSGRENIRDFIACVAHGTLTGIFPANETTRLLYAAQVAQAGAERQPPKQKTSTE